MRNFRAMAPAFFSAIILFTLVLIGFLQPGYSESVSQLKSADEDIRRSMVQMSRQLGVECTTCHISKNFASSEKTQFRVAREHMKLTQLLIDNGMNGKNKQPKADCFMCHRGKLMPDYKEPFDPMTMKKEKANVPQTEDF